MQLQVVFTMTDDREPDEIGGGVEHRDGSESKSGDINLPLTIALMMNYYLTGWPGLRKMSISPEDMNLHGDLIYQTTGRD